MTALDFDLQEAGTHCSQCFRFIQDEESVIKPEEQDRLNSVYCSKECQIKHKSQSQSLLFTLENPVPEPIAAEMSPEDVEKRRVAQEAFTAALKANKKIHPLLLARFIARSVAGETAKLFESTGVVLPPQDLPPTDGGDYSLHDHLERLRYLELQPQAEDIALLKAVFEHALPGLESFVTDERYAQLLGKIAFNSYGVSFDGGRDDRVSARAIGYVCVFATLTGVLYI
jgi:mitochondrial import receptor subunit TOM20